MAFAKPKPLDWFFPTGRPGNAASPMSLSFPFFDRVDIFVDRGRLVACGAAAALLIAGLIFGLAHLFPFSSLDYRVAASIVLTGIVMLSAKILAHCYRVPRWWTPVLTVDSHGVTDRRLGPEAIPWERIRDIRLLDDWGYRITLDIHAIPSCKSESRNLPARSAAPGADAANPVIDTFFLRTPTGNRVMDIVMPMTMFAPIDFTLAVPTQDVLDADRAASRAGRQAHASFALFAIILPICAAAYPLWA